MEEQWTKCVNLKGLTQAISSIKIHLGQIQPIVTYYESSLGVIVRAAKDKLSDGLHYSSCCLYWHMMKQVLKRVKTDFTILHVVHGNVAQLSLNIIKALFQREANLSRFPDCCLWTYDCFLYCFSGTPVVDCLNAISCCFLSKCALKYLKLLENLTWTNTTSFLEVAW